MTRLFGLACIGVLLGACGGDDGAGSGDTGNSVDDGTGAATEGADESDAGEDSESGAVGEEGGGVELVPVDECASGRKWVGGNEESPLMRPGGDCIGCHMQMGEGPSYLVAGTVYAKVGEADDCFGLADATVEVTDADGMLWSLTTNQAGNFWISQNDGPIAFPYTAKVLHGGSELAMATPQSEGSCASCHTQTGANLAAGRIFAP